MKDSMVPKAPRAKPGPKPIAIDEKLVEKLATIMCTMKEIGAVIGCSVDTLERRFAEIIEKGRENGKMSLKRKQYEIAMGGNVTMLIWLGKQHLGQTNKEEFKHEYPNPTIIKGKFEGEEDIVMLADKRGEAK